ncbi:uncharacterized protein LOC109704632, partial [Ananas comosus]|uniref:Uncharacterized protein LOC109704632 n=1 Tax=Ananas comosus TaxID=4615 RepID=A0A6P5EHF0_ANACO
RSGALESPEQQTPQHKSYFGLPEQPARPASRRHARARGQGRVRGGEEHRSPRCDEKPRTSAEKPEPQERSSGSAGFSGHAAPGRSGRRRAAPRPEEEEEGSLACGGRERAANKNQPGSAGGRGGEACDAARRSGAADRREGRPGTEESTGVILGVVGAGWRCGTRRGLGCEQTARRSSGGTGNAAVDGSRRSTIDPERRVCRRRSPGPSPQPEREREREKDGERWDSGWRGELRQPAACSGGRARAGEQGNVWGGARG